MSSDGNNKSNDDRPNRSLRRTTENSSFRRPLLQREYSSLSCMSSQSSVCFDEAVTVTPIERVREEERDQIWYSEKEYKKIKRVNHVCIQLQRAGSFKESDEHTFFGLEKQMSDRKLKQKVERRIQLLKLETEQD